MIISYTYDSKKFPFIKKGTLEPNRNIFTVLVGKNGTGKSTMLSNITSLAVGEAKLEHFYRDIDEVRNRRSKGKLDCDIIPRKVISISTSPFDKFPFSRRLEHIEGYSYLGLRGLMSYNFGVAYLSKIIGSLVEAVTRVPGQIAYISRVLEYLGYKPIIKASFIIEMSGSRIEQFLSAPSPNEAINGSRYTPPFLNRRFFLLDDVTINEDRYQQAVTILQRILKNKVKGKINLTISDEGIFVGMEYPESNDDLLFLIQSGFLRLRNVILEPIAGGESFSIKDASSGEQSIILSILGIASQIQDNSLICIDEPEICLHPAWQERYIQLLISTFREYKSCHFIIATHSPQIVSRLEAENCFILSMESRKVVSSKLFIRQSIDFQLANVFNSPGFKNEYLGRISINIFSKVGRYKKFDADDLKNLEILRIQSVFLDPEDPILDLYKAIVKLKELYG